VGKPRGKRPLGKPRHMWVDNVRMGIVDVGWGEQVESSSEFGIEPSGSIKRWETIECPNN
jgi:hypothetical protein